MDLRQIRYFIRIAELGSFSKAAQQLHIAQPALSRHVQSLEAEFGTRLLARTTRGVAATEAGQLLIEHGSNLLSGAMALHDAVRSASSRPSGEVTVGLPPSLSSLVIRNLVDDCSIALPDVDLRVVEGVSIFLEEWLDRGSLDMAIVTERPTVQRFDTAWLFTEDFLLVGCLGDGFADRKSVDRETLSRIDLVMTRGFRELVSEQLGPGVLRCKTEVDSLAVIREMLQTDGAASVLPRGVIQRNDWHGLFRALPFDNRPPSRSLVVATNPRRPKSAAAKAVRQVLLARLCPPAGRDAKPCQVESVQ